MGDENHIQILHKTTSKTLRYPPLLQPPRRLRTMRPLRLFLSLLFSLVFVTFLLYLSISTDPDQYADPENPREGRHRLRSYFFFHNPASLFTPAATISLTDDNSTFFAARPAAFGPLLPFRGISGQLWVGSGFGDDNLNRRGLLAGAEGELGCGDIPGWTNHNWHLAADGYASSNSVEGIEGAASESSHRSIPQGSAHSRRESQHSQIGDEPAHDDGTDDYLHYPLPSTTISRRTRNDIKRGRRVSVEHGDIQSLQESVEIAGKVVILSRGGCGFSEKVKWGQRRGATAVIIGDNVLGGALVRMYAQGDAANITIPSLFTSHMSAHLLSSLIPKGHDKESPASGTLWKWISAPVQESTGTNNDIGTASTYKIGTVVSQDKLEKDKTAGASSGRSSGPGWFKSSLIAMGLRKDSSMPIDHDGNIISYEKRVGTEVTVQGATTAKAPIDVDSFIIGVHDWRDPDVVVHRTGQSADATLSQSVKVSSTASKGKHELDTLRGGIITPGSGEYERPRRGQVSSEVLSDLSRAKPSNAFPGVGALKPAISFPGRSGLDTINAYKNEKEPSSDLRHHTTLPMHGLVRVPLLNEGSGRVGLWVTLTPTDMSASPFFNTLFVLVISPLITLAIVYSMLLIRSRIRRRRWRAPKSVVERLPVHVYQRSSRSSTSALPEPASPTPSSATTPLLSTTRPTEITLRPRSHTVDVTPTSLPSSSRYGSIESDSAEQEKEKVSSGLSEWKRKYKGKQIECVVCLEEYVDGVSRVMSLPCGHEFHVDCM